MIGFTKVKNHFLVKNVKNLIHQGILWPSISKSTKTNNIPANFAQKSFIGFVTWKFMRGFIQVKNLINAGIVPWNFLNLVQERDMRRNVIQNYTMTKLKNYSFKNLTFRYMNWPAQFISFFYVWEGKKRNSGIVHWDDLK